MKGKMNMLMIDTTDMHTLFSREYDGLIDMPWEEFHKLKMDSELNLVLPDGRHVQLVGFKHHDKIVKQVVGTDFRPYVLVAAKGVKE